MGQNPEPSRVNRRTPVRSPRASTRSKTAATVAFLSIAYTILSCGLDLTCGLDVTRGLDVTCGPGGSTEQTAVRSGPWYLARDAPVGSPASSCLCTDGRRGRGHCRLAAVSSSEG